MPKIVKELKDIMKDKMIILTRKYIEDTANTISNKPEMIILKCGWLNNELHTAEKEMEAIQEKIIYIKGVLDIYLKK